MLERATGIEPVSEAWEAAVLPLNYARYGLVLAQVPTDGITNSLPQVGKRIACAFARGLNAR